jgi:hypothetical protein
VLQPWRALRLPELPQGQCAARPAQSQDALADADLVADLDVDFGHDAPGRSRNRRDGFFVFEFDDGLVFGNRVAFIHEDADDHATV